MRINSLDFAGKISGVPLVAEKKTGTSFIDTLKNIINETDSTIKKADQTALDLASGKSSNIHEAMLNLQKADISMRLLVASTNKLIEGYNELMRLR